MKEQVYIYRLDTKKVFIKMYPLHLLYLPCSGSGHNDNIIIREITGMREMRGMTRITSDYTLFLQ